MLFRSMLALHLYRRFHSEWAQQWGRQTIFTQIMKILAGMLMMFLVFGIHFFDDPVTNALLGCLVGAPLGFLLVEGVTGKGFSKLRSNGRSIEIHPAQWCPLSRTVVRFAANSIPHPEKHCRIQAKGLR